MQVFVETTSGLGRRLTIEIPSDNIDEAVKKRLTEIAKTAKVDGFRPGKVPASVLEKRYGDGIRQEILGDQLQASFVEAIQQEKIVPAGRPDINIVQFEKGKPVRYEATFEVYPEINLVELHDADIEQYSSELTDADVNTAIENLRKQYAEYVEEDKVAEEGDQVEIDFDGYIDGESFDGGKAENVPLVLGSKTMIPGFEDGVVGMKAGEEKSINVTFPEDYHSKDHAGKAAEFKIKVHKVAKAKLPEIDDAFVEKVGIKEGGVEKFNQDFRKRMHDNLKASLEMKNKMAVLDKLLELNEIEIPKALVDDEMEALREQFLSHFPQQLKTDQMPEIDKEIFRDQAVRRVSLGLLMAEVVKKYDIKPNEEEVRKIVEDMAAGYDDSQKVIDFYMSDKKHLAHFEQINAEDQVVAKLRENAKVTEKMLQFDEVVKQ